MAGTTDFAGLLTFAQPWSDHIAGLRVRRATRLPWVAHFSDPWVDSPHSSTTRWQMPLWRLWRRIEASVIREATAVVFVSGEAADLVMSKYPGHWRDKVAVVPHGFDPRGTDVAGRRDGPLRIVYTGRFYEGIRTPIALLDGVARLHAREPLAGVAEITFVGPHVEPFAVEAARRGLDGVVRCLPRVPAREAVNVAADADVLLVIDAPLPSTRRVTASPFLPSKLVDYLPLRKLILGLTPPNGASAALLRRLGCPIVAPDDIDGIATAFADLLRRWRANAIEPPPAFAQVAAEYDIRCTTARLHEVLLRAFNTGVPA